MATDLKERIGTRLNELVGDGERLLKQFPNNDPVPFQQRDTCVSWMLSVVTVLEVSLPATSRHRVEALRLLMGPQETIFPSTLASILGVVKSAAAEWSAGLMGSLELHFTGLAFEDFLRHAADSNRAGHTEVAAVLASTVLEDTIKKLCDKHGIATDDKALDALISALKTKKVLGKIKGERLRSYAAVRNKAFHAEWNQFDQKDLGQMIEDLQELIETHFGNAANLAVG